LEQNFDDLGTFFGREEVEVGEDSTHLFTQVSRFSTIGRGGFGVEK
jgi:hypothetical protein